MNIGNEYKKESLDAGKILFNIYGDEQPTIQEIESRKEYLNSINVDKKEFFYSYQYGFKVFSMVFVAIFVIELLFPPKIGLIDVVLTTSLAAIITIFFASFFEKNPFQEIKKEINHEKRNLSLIEEKDYPHIVEICDKSSVCNNYKNKVLKSGRMLTKRELEFMELDFTLQQQAEINKKMFNVVELGKNVRQGYNI